MLIGQISIRFRNTFALLVAPYVLSLLSCISVTFAAPAGAGQVPEADHGRPKVFWASDPAAPDDTILVTGADLQSVTAVRVARMSDLQTVHRAGAGTPRNSPRRDDNGPRLCPVLQPTTASIKFVLPASFKPGAFLCTLMVGATSGRTFTLNRPDPWWLQGDLGGGASPGGWVRVFGKALCFGDVARLALRPAGRAAMMLRCGRSDGFELMCALPTGLAPGHYDVSVQNGFGGDSAWASAGGLEVKPRPNAPPQVFNVMDFYGTNAEKEIRRTLEKGSAVVDRTEAIVEALKKADRNGGGTVYFPEGKYAINGEIHVPPHTILKGAGMGLVVLFWGKGGFALDGGSDARRLTDADADVPSTLLSGSDFSILDMSLYFPREYRTGIEAGANTTIQRVRMRVDRYWIRNGEREDGLAMRLGENCRVSDCDVLAKGVAFAFSQGRNELISGNKVMAGKSHISLERGDGVIVEDNDFISLDPTAYINLSGEGRNIYYARNRHESFFVHQSDFSWTFDGTGMAYLGKAARANGTLLTLAADPTYPAWAGETSSLWRRSVVCVLDGRGAGQYRFVTANHGRDWQIDRPFDVPPDAESILSIIPYRGRVLVVGNRFEDAGWVNMGYGSSFDVICAHNSLYRVGEMLNLGLRDVDGVHASWYIQYLDNDIYEGDTLVQTTADMRGAKLYSGPTSRYAIHRRQHLHADNSGRIDIGGNATDVIVEHCIFDNARGSIDVGRDTEGIVLRENQFSNGPPQRYRGDGIRRAVVSP